SSADPRLGRLGGTVRSPALLRRGRGSARSIRPPGGIRPGGATTRGPRGVPGLRDRRRRHTRRPERPPVSARFQDGDRVVFVFSTSLVPWITLGMTGTVTDAVTSGGAVWVRLDGDAGSRVQVFPNSGWLAKLPAEPGKS